VRNLPALKRLQEEDHEFDQDEPELCSKTPISKENLAAECRCFTPAILAIQEAAIRRLVVRSQPEVWLKW
jgi:hypothetical protein